MHFHFHGHGGRGAGPTASLPSLPPPSESSMDLILLEAAKHHFRREGSQLQTQADGEEEWLDVILVRLFPLSDRDRWVSLLKKDGSEIGVFKDLAGLSDADARLIQEELRRRYLVPHIERITACRPKFDLMEWTVETDRGEVKFLTRNLREQMQQPYTRHLTLTDVEGNRYDIPDLERLDPGSRRRLDEQL